MDAMQSVHESPAIEHEQATPPFENGASSGATPDTRMDTINEYFRESTATFQTMIRSAMDTLLENIQRVEKELEKTVEFQSQRIDELEKAKKSQDKTIKSMELEVNQLRGRVSHLEEEINKNERFSRRNNFRIVGIKEAEDPTQENCVSMVEGILHDKFGMQVKVERAHRDGTKRDNRPRHILVKTLSYRDKTQIMKSARDKLKNTGYFIVDDLTKKDLGEKRKWAEKVKALYSGGTKLRFYAGKWRGNAGEPFKFM